MTHNDNEEISFTVTKHGHMVVLIRRLDTGELIGLAGERAGEQDRSKLAGLLYKKARRENR